MGKYFTKTVVGKGGIKKLLGEKVGGEVKVREEGEVRVREDCRLRKF